MNPGLIARLLAFLLLMLALFMLIPFAVALLYGEQDLYADFLIPIIATIGGTVLILLLVRPRATELRVRDGFLLVSLSWIGVSLIGALPFWLSGAIPRYVDSFFETMSGFTTTGASILTEIETLPRSLLFWRSLTHWLGGMGIIVLTLALFPILGIGGLKLFRAEAPGPTVDKITPRLTATAKILWAIYLALTVAQTSLLLIAGMDLFDALTHTFGTLATGGFSPRTASVAAYDLPAAHIIITIFMVMAGINFVIYYKLITGRIDSVLRDPELRGYLLIFGIATLLITIALQRSGLYETLGESLRLGSFQAASVLTTTGYVIADYGQWPSVARALLLLLMFFGGCSGSTGGGIKIVRIIVLLRQGFVEMKNLLHPRAVFSHRLGESIGERRTLFATAGFLTLYLALLLLTTLIVSSAGQSLITSFSTALATLGNIGPGFGLIGATGNYAHFPDALKWYLGFVMLLGRLEIYTILILFIPRFWRR